MDNRVKKETKYNQKQLEERLAYWQEKLRLQDWSISIQFAEINELENHQEAMCYTITNNKEAKIVLKPFDHIDHSQQLAPVDMEWSLVHELLHIHFEMAGAPSDGSIALEQAIESLVYGFIKLEREAARHRLSNMTTTISGGGMNAGINPTLTVDAVNTIRGTGK